MPIKTGVPFPQGVLTSLDCLALFETNGARPVVAQFNELAKWPDGSIKDVLVQFVGDLGSETMYRLAYGDGVRTPSPQRTVTITRTSDELTVDTGVVQFGVDRRGVLDSLFRDVDGDGRFADDEQIIDTGNLTLTDAIDNRVYSASPAGDADIAVEESGPVRAVVRARGTFTSADRRHALKFQVRYYASLRSANVDLELTIIDDRLEAEVGSSPSTLAISLKDLALRWHLSRDGHRSFRLGGDNGRVYSGDASGEHYLLQEGEFHYVAGQNRGFTFSYSGAGAGDRAPGWLDVSAGGKHLGLSIRDFWQQFPAELNVAGDTVRAVLFPARSIHGVPDTKPHAAPGTRYRRPNTLYFLRPGGAKTYAVRLTAFDTTPTAAELASANERYQSHDLDLAASPGWYTASGVWGELEPGGMGTSTANYDASLLNDILIPSTEGMTAHDAVMFGWRDWGDRLHAGRDSVAHPKLIPTFYDDTHVGANNFFKQFIRTGDQRWFAIGDVATRHFMDIDVSHGPRSGYWKTGHLPQPAGELKGQAHDNVDHEERNLHQGHAHVSGLSELYLLTGDKRALEVLAEIAGWWRFVTPYVFALPFQPSGEFREAERDFGWPLYVMNEYVRVTGDAAYHREVAGHLVRYLIEWWQTPLAHIGYNPRAQRVSNEVVNINDARQGTGYWTMSVMDNCGTADRATGANPWMAGALISNLIKFYEQDRRMRAAGHGAGIPYPTLLDMLLQAENYIVRYGYVGNAANGEGYFAYSETIRDDDGGDHHVLYGLAYLDRLFKQELAAGRLKHPEWYDTEAFWLPIVKKRYDDLRRSQVGAETESRGFYGYEMVYPPDFFRIAREARAPSADRSLGAR